MTGLLLLADVGGTYVRLRSVGPGGVVRQEVKEICPGPGDGSFPTFIRDLSDAIERSGVAREPALAAAVITGRAAPSALADGDRAQVLGSLARAGSVTLVPDGVAAYVGCLGDRPGVVVSAGTGTIAIVLDHGGRVRRLDGWGPQLGDAGSGYRVGLDGLISACRWSDGRRGGSQLLYEAAFRAFGPVERLPWALQPVDQLRNIARFSAPVVAAARLGDVAAGRILDKAAQELMELAADAAGSMAGGPPPVVIAGGFVSEVPELAERVRAWCLANSQPAPVIAPASSALDGCYRIATQGVPEPFVPWVQELK